MRPSVLIPILAAFLLAACNVPPAELPTLSPIPSPTAPAAPPAQTSTPSATATPAAPDLTLEQLRNLTYAAPQYQRQAALKDGQYETGSGADYYMAALSEQAAFGDLDGDGRKDAAVLLAENGGGSGVFVSLVALLNRSGQPSQAADVLVDDRPVINSLAIQNGRILLDARIHGPSDPMVNPTLSVVETYLLGDGALLLTGLTSSSSGSAIRSIRIDAPVDGAQVSGSVRVKGSMPIGPFENYLSYRVYDLKGTLLAQGPFGVQAADMGAPATFDNPVDLSALKVSGQVSLQLWDVSMADGSPIAISSVLLDVR